MSMNPYDSTYIDEHLEDFYAFELAVREHYRGRTLEHTTVVALYTVMKREKSTR